MITSIIRESGLLDLQKVQAGAVGKHFVLLRHGARSVRRTRPKPDGVCPDVEVRRVSSNANVQESLCELFTRYSGLFSLTAFSLDTLKVL